MRALRIRAINELGRNSTYYIIGGSGLKFYQAMGKSYEEIEKKRIKKRIHKKLISSVSEKQSLEQDQFRKFAEFRYLPDDFPITSSINIYNDTVAIIIWETEPIIVTIKNEKVAESYRKYFSQLCELAKS